MAKALIASVGGTPEPIVITFSEEQPEFVCFFASQKSVDQIADIKRKAGATCQDEKELTEDPDDLVECYRTALNCIDRVRRHGISLDDTLVDYTGGTKVMGAALAMAAGSHNVRFSYVGGSARSKGGLGTVETGAERRRIDRNPWQLFAVEEKRRIAQYFNSYQYGAATQGLKALLPRLSDPERLILDAISTAADAYAAWDRFDHRAAWNSLGKARQLLTERCQMAGRSEYAEFLSVLDHHVLFLSDLREQTDQVRRSHVSLVGDLVANAERRIEEHKFDDAIARLYRAVEMVGQVRFEQVLGVSTSKVPTSQVPESLRDEYVRRYWDEKSGYLKIGLAAAYQVLIVIGDPIGAKYVERQKKLEQLLGARNGSILAHGLVPLSEERARQMLEVALTLLPSELPRPRFPRLPW